MALRILGNGHPEAGSLRCAFLGLALVHSFGLLRRFTLEMAIKKERIDALTPIRRNHGGSFIRLFGREHAVSRDILETLNGPARPPDFKKPNAAIGSEAKMHALVV